MTTGLVRFGSPKTVVCNLGTSGTLVAHSIGAAYSGTFNVTNAVGDITAELVSATPPLPAGWTLSVNQATDQVTLSWPAAAPVSAPPLPNLGFESGASDWLLGNGWVINSDALVDAGTQSAKYNGPGQSTLRHAQAVPVTPGQSITATARISKGTNREDFAGGAAVLEWLTSAGAPLSFSVGNVVNTGSSAFQTSTVTASAPTGAGLVRLGVSGTRDLKGRSSDRVYADAVSWNHSYALPGAPATDYSVVIRVRDERGCQATFSQTINYGRDVEFALTGIANHTSPAGTTQVYNANIPADTQVGDTLLFYVYEVGGNSFNGVGVSGWTSIGRTTGGISATGFTPRIGSGGGEGMIARAQDVANGTVPVLLWAQNNTVIMCIKIPAAMGVLNISTTSNQNANSANSGSGSSIATSGSISPTGGVAGNFYVFAFARVMGGATFTGMPFSRRQATITGPGTLGSGGTAQSVAVCYNGVLNGNSFTGGTFTFTGAPASSTRMASMLILRTNAPVT